MEWKGKHGKRWDLKKSIPRIMGIKLGNITDYRDKNNSDKEERILIDSGARNISICSNLTHEIWTRANRALKGEPVGSNG